MFMLPRQRGRIDHLAFSPGGQTLAAAQGTSDPTIRIWNLTERKPLGLLRPSCPVAGLTFVKDDATLVVRPIPVRHHGRAVGGLWLWDMATEQTRTLLGDEGAVVYACALAEDGESLFVALYSWLPYSHGIDIRQVDLSTWQERPCLQYSFNDALAGLAIRPGRPILAAVRLQPWTWRILVLAAPGRMPVEIDLPRSAPVVSMAFAPGGRTLALCIPRSVRLWDIKTAQAVAKVNERSTIHATAFSPDGRTLATATADGVVRLYDVDTGQRRAAFDWQIGPVYALAFAPDGMRAAAGGQKGTIVVWDVEG